MYFNNKCFNYAYNYEQMINQEGGSHTFVIVTPCRWQTGAETCGSFYMRYVNCTTD